MNPSTGNSSGGNSSFQEGLISGRVFSEDNSEPLAGANITYAGTSIGTISDIDGRFQLTFEEQYDSLLVSYIGYLPKTIAIGNRTEININLAVDTKMLNELVVTAFGIAREKEKLTTTIQELSGKQVSDVRETNFINSLSGKVAGVNVTGNANTLGGSANIVIRGANSITGNNQPLFVVDGVPINNTSFATLEQQSGRNGNESEGVNIAGNFDFGNPAQDINPDDIESISVLKGANGAALYGSRAANGVILITTKTGRGKKGLGVSINSSVQVQQPFLFADYQNEYGGGSGDFNRFAEDGTPIAWGNSSWSWGPRLDGQPVMHWDDERRPWVANPDNIEDFYENGVTYSNNIALTSNGNFGSFRLSITDLDQTGISPNSKLDRQNFSINATSYLSDRLSASAQANYTTNKVTGRSVNGDNEESIERYMLHYSFNRQVDLSRLENYENPDGSMRSWLRDQNGDATGIVGNPYWTRYKNFSYDERDRLFGNVSLTYEFADWLKLTARAGTDFYNDRREERLSIGTPRQIPFYSEDIRFVQESNFDAILQLDKQLSEQFSLSALIGGNALRYENNRNRGRTQGGLSTDDFYNLENSIDRPLITDNTFRKRINSVFSSVTLGYRNMLYVDASIRNDWSSTLPADNNSYLYPSVGANFIFTEVLNAGWLTFGKLRANYAEVGNDTDPYQLQTVYAPGNSFGSNPVYYVPESLNNDQLKPERTTSLELGTNLQFFDNRLELDVTYYHSVTKDQIFGVPVSPTSGYKQQIINAGEMENKGLEIMLRGTPISTAGGFTWDVMLNYAKNDNQVVSLADGIDFIQLAQYYDMQLLAIPGEPYGTLYSTAVARDAEGNMLVTNAGQYKQGPRQVVGNVQPDFIGGVTNTLSYKGLSLSVLVDFKSGGDLFSGGIRSGTRSGIYAESAANNVRELGVVAIGVNENDGRVNDVRVSAQNFFNGLRGNYGFFVWDASYVKLREMRLAYTLPAKLIANTPFTRIQAAVIGRNLAILHKVIPHIDPEVAVSAGNVQGIEVGSLPGTRTFGFNLNLSF